MHVICKKCGTKILIQDWPAGTNSLSNVSVSGNVNIGGGAIGFGPGGSISFSPGGSIALGGPPKARIQCGACNSIAEYERQEAKT